MSTAPVKEPGARKAPDAPDSPLGLPTPFGRESHHARTVVLRFAYLVTSGYRGPKRKSSLLFALQDRDVSLPSKSITGK